MPTQPTFTDKTARVRDRLKKARNSFHTAKTTHLWRVTNKCRVYFSANQRSIFASSSAVQGLAVFALTPS